MDAVLALPVFIMLMLVLCLDPVAVPVFMSCDMMSIGTGKIIVLLCSAEMLFRVCRYRNCKQSSKFLNKNAIFQDLPVKQLGYLK